MSRLLVSDSYEVASRFKKKCVECGFRESNFISENGLSLSSFKKLKVDNINYYEENGNFVSISGTLIYKEHIGTESLASLLRDFCKHGSVEEIRKNVIGNYMCVICNDGTITSFCDSRNIFYLYYYTNNGNWCLSNCLYEMAVAIGKDNISVDENVLLEEMYSRCVWGNETIFKEIKRLQGDEYISLDVKTGKLEVRNCGESWQMIEDDFNRTVKRFSEELIQICTVVKNVFPSQSVAMTGGMDSRAVLAGLLGAGCHPHLLYGVGNGQLIETRNEDKQIIGDIQQRFNLPVSYLDWSSPKQIDQAWDDLSSRFGFLGRVYSGSPNLHNSLIERDEDFIVYGYFGESYSFEDTLLKKEFTLNDFLDYYIGNRVKGIATDYQQYREHISNKVKYTLAKNGINSEKISINDWIRLELEMRRKKDTVMVSLSNQHRYSFAILGEENLLRYSFCPVDYKKNRRFLLNMINQNCPGLLEVPIFSHGEFRKIDKRKLTLKTTLAMMARDRVKKYIKSNKGRHLSYLIYKMVQGGRKGRKEVSNVNSTVNQLQKIYSELHYQPHNIFSEASTNISLEARYVLTAKILQMFK